MFRFFYKKSFLIILSLYYIQAIGTKKINFNTYMTNKKNNNLLIFDSPLSRFHKKMNEVKNQNYFKYKNFS